MSEPVSEIMDRIKGHPYGEDYGVPEIKEDIGEVLRRVFQATTEKPQRIKTLIKKLNKPIDKQTRLA